ncbi:zinc metalloprotease HtpX [Shewanella sp. A32]|uniref:zinc metalloprotease HtpX n=1 Tax=Shewanella sp. A32 TaxID=3031327 RepID=UPI0023B92B41|nr:zinc metalloprotease HtpX [Shewanella sp. A32]MDF0535879.1 zinc metalloprotease HtpX [Shewanella sp. A32]
MIDRVRWQQHARRNFWHSALLLSGMAGFLALLGWLFAGSSGLLLLLMAGVMLWLFRSSVSPWMVMRLYNARPLSPQQFPALWQLVQQLAQTAGLPVMPQLFLLPNPLINAFAVGSQQRPLIAITDAALRQLQWRELAGVLAHELSHVRSNDLQVMSLADMFSRGTSLLSMMGQLLLLLNLPLIMFGWATINWWAILLLLAAPTISTLAQLALSRTREYDADLNAVRMTSDPQGLASALSKIERQQQGWLRRMIMPGATLPVPSLLRTHPETKERVERLLALQQRWPYQTGTDNVDNPFHH